MANRSSTSFHHPIVDQIFIRLAVKTDLPALEWEGEYTHFRRLFSEAYRRSEKGLTLMWVAELPGKGIIGQAFIQLTCDRPELANGFNRAYLYSFRVRAQFRNLGIGTKILQVIEADLIDRGYQYITLNVARDNQDAQRLYEKLGYKIVAPEPGIWSYQDEKGEWRTVEEPAWRMEKRIYKTFS